MPLLARVGRMFPRNDAVDVVRTKVHYDASPEAVWNGMLFYEEVPRRPMPLLRWFLPAPVRTQGEKTRAGALIECVYEGGYLEKQITSVERARSVCFEVRVQELGVEDSISMLGGSYELREDAGGCELTLMTSYRGHLRPRWLWRPLESFLAHRMHRHILDGMRASVEGRVPHVAELPESSARG